MYSDPNASKRNEECSNAVPTVPPERPSGEKVKTDSTAIQKPSDTKHNYNEGIPRNWETIFAGYLAIVNTAALIIYGYQLTEMRKSTDAATRAAQSAEEATKLAKATTRLDQRAWVAPAEITGTPVVGSPLEVQVKIQNFGKTFAYEMTTVGGAIERKRGVLSHFGYLETEPDFEHEVAQIKPASRTILPPTGTAPIAATLPIGKDPVTAEYLNQIKSGQTTLYIFGKITYKDVFGVPHWLTYCFLLGPDLLYRSNNTYSETDTQEYQ